MRRVLPTPVLVLLVIMGCSTVLVSVTAAQKALRHTKRGFVGCYQRVDIDAFTKAMVAGENSAVYMLAAGACLMLPDTSRRVSPATLLPAGPLWFDVAHT